MRGMIPGTTIVPRSAPRVSVIIPNYNYGRYLSAAIDSVLGQTYSHLEVIVVDDGSTDGSEAVLRGYEGRVSWFQQRNQGVSAARNRGIQESRGELIAFLDADDVWHPQKIERQIAVLQDPAVGIVCTGLQYISTSGQSLGTNLCGGRGRVLHEFALLRKTVVLAGGSSVLVRKECFTRAGLFDAELSTSADWDMWRRIACYYDIEVVREPLISYRLHSSAMHRDVGLMERDMLRAFAKMFADPAASRIRPLRRECYSNLYMILCGSYFQARRWDACLRCMARSLVLRPAGILYLASFPFRRLGRVLGRRTAGLEPTIEC
jgi:glycosyltransferase involved in cell wall biosynthesis